MANRYFKDLTSRIASDRIFCIYTAKNPKYYGYQRCLSSVVYKCFDQKNFG